MNGVECGNRNTFSFNVALVRFVNVIGAISFTCLVRLLYEHFFTTEIPNPGKVGKCSRPAQIIKNKKGKSSIHLSFPWASSINFYQFYRLYRRHTKDRAIIFVNIAPVPPWAPWAPVERKYPVLCPEWHTFLCVELSAKKNWSTLYILATCVWFMGVEVVT